MVVSELGTPLVSVVIPFHNRLGWVAEAVESVKAQTYSNIEIILVDDGSTEDVSAGLDLEDKAIQYVRQSNKGPSGARNYGIDLAQGEFVAFLDSDDLFTPEKVARQVAGMLDHPDVVLSHTSYQRIDESGNLLEIIHSGQYSGWVFPEILLGCGIATPTVMVRRSALGGKLRFNEGIRVGEDLLIWAQLARESAILGIDEPLSRVRLHGGNAALDRDAQIQGLYNLQEHGIRRSPGISASERRKLLAINYDKIADLHYRNGQKWRARTCQAFAWMNDPGGNALNAARSLARFIRHYMARSVVLCIKGFFVSINTVRLAGTAGFLLVNSKARSNQQRRFLVVSHVLPPSWSGQAVILGRLLKGIDASFYCVTSINNYDETGDRDRSGVLPARYHVLDPEVLLPGSGRCAWIKRINVYYNILQRGVAIGNIIYREQCSKVIACTGDLVDPPAASLAAKLTGASFYLYAFDDYTFQWLDPVLRNQAWSFEKWIVQASEGIIAPNEFMATEIGRRHKRDVQIVRNARAWFPKAVAVSRKTGEYARCRTGRLVYTGAVYHVNTNTFRVIMAALKRIHSPGVCLHIYTAQSEEYLRQQGICSPHIAHHPHAPYEEVEQVQAQADVLLMAFDFNSPARDVIRTAAPGKLGDYLGSGVPILAIVPGDTFVAWYLRRYDCGMVVDRADVDAVADAILRLLLDAELCERIVANAVARASEDFDPGLAQRTLLRTLGMSL